jgi:hypothetical protein
MGPAFDVDFSNEPTVLILGRVGTEIWVAIVAPDCDFKIHTGDIREGTGTGSGVKCLNTQ